MIKLKNYTILKDLYFLDEYTINKNNLIYTGLNPIKKLFDLAKNKNSYISLQDNVSKWSANDLFIGKPLNKYFESSEIYHINQSLEFALIEGLNTYNYYDKKIKQKVKNNNLKIITFFNKSFFEDLKDFNGVFFGKNELNQEFLVGFDYSHKNYLKYFICREENGNIYAIKDFNNDLINNLDNIETEILILLWLYQKNLNEIKYIQFSNNYNNKRKNSFRTHLKMFTELNYTSIIRDQPFDVKGHWRKQKCGIGRSEEKLIFIDSFQKNGYKRFIKSA